SRCCGTASLRISMPRPKGSSQTISWPSSWTSSRSMKPKRSRVDNFQKYLDPATLAKIQGLDLKARLIVEGYLAGLHKSPYQGFSVEFAEHREYAAGDDIKHVDWKVWSRTDKLYLKQYEEETNLVTYLLLDVSESMGYQSDGVSKLDYARYIAAALAYLVLQQQDSVGLATFDSEVRQYARPSSHASHLNQILHLMDVV